MCVGVDADLPNTLATSRISETARKPSKQAPKSVNLVRGEKRGGAFGGAPFLRYEAVLAQSVHVRIRTVFRTVNGEHMFANV